MGIILVCLQGLNGQIIPYLAIGVHATHAITSLLSHIILSKGKHPSTGKTTRIGPTHTDTYHTDNSGKRDRPHHTDLKVSGPRRDPSMRDIYPPQKPGNLQMACA